MLPSPCIAKFIVGRSTFLKNMTVYRLKVPILPVVLFIKYRISSSGLTASYSRNNRTSSHCRLFLSILCTVSWAIKLDFVLLSTKRRTQKSFKIHPTVSANLLTEKYFSIKCFLSVFIDCRHFNLLISKLIDLL